MADDDNDSDDDFEFDDDLDESLPLDEHETELVRRDLLDLEQFEATFSREGYRGVSVFCQDCAEEHFFPWDMLRENLRTLLETGEQPVHEPAYAPDPDEYIPWEYARGYVDALSDVGVHDRVQLDACPRCRMTLENEARSANFCPRCGTALLAGRLKAALSDRDMADEVIDEVLRSAGLPGVGPGD